MIPGYLICREIMDEEPPPPPRRFFCDQCRLANIDYRKKPSIFNPLSLEHVAAAATLRAFRDFDPSQVNKDSYRAFKNICRSVNARYYLFSYDYFKYDQLSRIFEKIDQNYSNGFSTQENFSYAQPICCCTILNKCISEFPKCKNYFRGAYSRFRFSPVINGHRNNSACCCNGMRTAYCIKRFYVLQGINKANIFG